MRDPPYVRVFQVYKVELYGVEVKVSSASNFQTGRVRVLEIYLETIGVYVSFVGAQLLYLSL